MLARKFLFFNRNKIGYPFAGYPIFPRAFFIDYSTNSFKPLPGLNLGTFLAGIDIGLRVTGLIPIRFWRCITEKVPNPVSATCTPCFKAFPTILRNASRQSLHVDFDSFVIFAICSINFALFIQIPLLIPHGKANKMVLTCTL
jgi:hypothetical protein